MNAEPLERSLLISAVKALRELGLNVEREEKRNLRIRLGRQIVRYEAEIRRMTPTLRFSLGPRTNGVLVTDYVNPITAADFRRRQIQFVDSAGNAYLRRGNLFVFVSGQAAPARPRPSRTLAFRKSGLRAAFVLLSSPRLRQGSTRQIAQAAGVALGSVPGALQALRELGYVEEIRGKRRILNHERLIAQWTDAYARALEPTLLLQRFAGKSGDWWRDPRTAERYGVQWGGETAAAILTEEVVPEDIVFYGNDLPTRLITDHRLQPDPSGTVIVRKRFWNFDTEFPRREIVPPLLVYADLVTTGDSRLMKVAQTIYDEFVLRLIREE